MLSFKQRHYSLPRGLRIPREFTSLTSATTPTEIAATYSAACSTEQCTARLARLRWSYTEIPTGEDPYQMPPMISTRHATLCWAVATSQDTISVHRGHPSLLGTMSSNSRAVQECHMGISLGVALCSPPATCSEACPRLHLPVSHQTSRIASPQLPSECHRH